MNLSEYAFMLPAAAALILMVNYIVIKNRLKRVKSRDGLRSVCHAAKRLMLPKLESRLHSAYIHLCRFTRWKIEDVFKAKLMIFSIVLLALILVKLTNIRMYTGEIMYKFNYHSDLIYQAEGILDQEAAFRQEMEYFNKAIDVITPEMIEKTSKDEVQAVIKGIITEAGPELLQPAETISNKVYYRIYDYYKCRKWNLILYTAAAFLISFFIEIALLIFNFFAETESKKELRFLKKLIILNGSIKPVDFLKLLKVLVDKSRYHRRVLKEIEEMNKKNSVNNRDIYFSLIRNSKSIEMKLFYEKLDQANNYDFDQAIVNIENEFLMDRRSQARKIRKQTELIHAVGITGFMALIFILIIYLIIPWLEAYSMNQIF